MHTREPGRAPHRYEQIANDLREAILQGDYREGERLPGENAIMRDYGVARATARDALALIRHEGLAVARPGSGVFVLSRTRIVRDSTSRYSRTDATSRSPFRSDVGQAGRSSEWEHTSEVVKASSEVAQRLRIRPGDQTMHTSYRYFADKNPIQLAESWEPLAITAGTPIERPEDGPIIGVIARMDSIGQRVTHVVERVTARAATPQDINHLELPARGAYVLVIERTHYVDDRPVETCNITFPGERYELTYTIPVPD